VTVRNRRPFMGILPSLLLQSPRTVAVTRQGIDFGGGYDGKDL
jgi:hypothetical protein